MENAFKRIKKVEVRDVNRMNALLKQCKHLSKVSGPCTRDTYKIDVRQKWVVLEFNPLQEDGSFGGRTEFRFDMSKVYDPSEQSDSLYKGGMEAYSELQRLTHSGIPDLSKNTLYALLFERDGDGKLIVHSVDAYAFRLNSKGKRFDHCYGYDINSAYPYAATKPLPDTRVNPREGFVKDGELGFYMEDGILHPTLNKELPCDWIFPLMDSPLADAMKKLYNKKRTASGAARQSAKNVLNFSIGYIRLHNPFIHTTILWRASEYVKSFIEENNVNLLYSNTDSIVSADCLDNCLPIGDGMGQFKCEHRDQSFAVRNGNYQWGYGIPTVFGKAKGWFAEYIRRHGKWDLVSDPYPNEEYNPYYFKDMTIKLKEADHEEK